MQEGVIVFGQTQRPNFCEDTIPPAIFAAVRLLQICDPVQAIATDAPMSTADREQCAVHGALLDLAGRKSSGMLYNGVPSGGPN